MSELAKSDLDVIRDQYDATNERDWDRAVSHYDPDVRMEVRGGDITRGTFEGLEEVTAWFSRWFSSFEAIQFEISELTELGDGRILLIAHHTARGRSSGIELEDNIIWTYRLRDGRITEVIGHETREDAIAAAL